MTWPSAFNFTVEEQAHAAQHSQAEADAAARELKDDHSLTAEEAKFLTWLSAPLTLLTGGLACSAAYMETKCGWFLSRKAKRVLEQIANTPVEGDGTPTPTGR